MRLVAVSIGGCPSPAARAGDEVRLATSRTHSPMIFALVVFRRLGTAKVATIMRAVTILVLLCAGMSARSESAPDCTCDGEGLTLVSRVPRVGGMPGLCTYRCEACGHASAARNALL